MPKSVVSDILPSDAERPQLRPIADCQRSELVSDYERELHRRRVEELLAQIVELQAQVAELAARLLDQEGD